MLEGVSAVVGAKTHQVGLEYVMPAAELAHHSVVRRIDLAGLYAVDLLSIAWVRRGGAGLAGFWGWCDVELVAPLAQALEVFDAELGEEEGTVFVREGLHGGGLRKC